MERRGRYPTEVKERAVRLVFEQQEAHGSQWATISSIAGKMGFVEENRQQYGVEPMCAVLPIAPATYYEYRARRRDPDKRPARAKRDEQLTPEIRGSGTRTSRFMAPRRCGGSSAARASE